MTSTFSYTILLDGNIAEFANTAKEALEIAKRVSDETNQELQEATRIARTLRDEAEKNHDRKAFAEATNQLHEANKNFMDLGCVSIKVTNEETDEEKTYGIWDFQENLAKF